MIRNKNHRNIIIDDDGNDDDDNVYHDNDNDFLFENTAFANLTWIFFFSLHGKIFIFVFFYQFLLPKNNSDIFNMHSFFGFESLLAWNTFLYWILLAHP